MNFKIFDWYGYTYINKNQTFFDTLPSGQNDSLFITLNPPFIYGFLLFIY
jgi:hypothetical protein